MRAIGVVSVTLLLVSLGTIASARQQPSASETPATPRASASAPRALTTRAATRKAQSSVVVVTRADDGGEIYVAPAPVVVGRVDVTDPWSGVPIATTRSYAPLDVTDPWSGERVALRRHAAADASDPWR